jgi:1-aminocyclopropane-1-carboxylate deaminase/D-cysteine desulfhydrase-like pyridoxal-dependent ACC family enzyme
MALAAQMQRVAAEYEARGHRPYVLASTFHPLGAAAYVDCALELSGQLDAQRTRPRYVYVASAGATQVGLALDLHTLDRSMEVRGVNYTTSAPNMGPRLLSLAAECAALLGVAQPLTARELPNRSLGTLYGELTPEVRGALSLVAHTEGLLLDPVYTAKAMAALISDIKTGVLDAGETVVFVHTGGLPALFYFEDDLLEGGYDAG